EGAVGPDWTPPAKKTRQRPDKVQKLLDIALKLALIKGYNEKRQILAPDGTFLPNSDILHLLNYTLSPGKVLIGETEFIYLLRKAGVDPTIIVNEHVRSRLIALYQTAARSESPPSPPDSPHIPGPSIPPSPTVEQIPPPSPRPLSPPET